MKASPTPLAGVLRLDPTVFEDFRGHFYDSYRADKFLELGIVCRFVQEGQSTSRRGVLRGLHYQRRHTQEKVVRVLRGEVFDVVLDLRRGSPTFGRWAGEVLSAENRRQLFIPAGLAHGFLVLSETADVAYRFSDYYAPAEERGVRWDDPALAIAWPSVGSSPVLNQRDASFPVLADILPVDLP